MTYQNNSWFFIYILLIAFSFLLCNRTDTTITWKKMHYYFPSIQDTSTIKFWFGKNEIPHATVYFSFDIEACRIVLQLRKAKYILIVSLDDAQNSQWHWDFIMVLIPHDVYYLAKILHLPLHEIKPCYWRQIVPL